MMADGLLGKDVDRQGGLCDMPDCRFYEEAGANVYQGYPRVPTVQIKRASFHCYWCRWFKGIDLYVPKGGIDVAL